MANFVSVRISNKFEMKAELAHDFHYSHGRKINDKPNFAINGDGSVTPFYRDVTEKISVTDIIKNHGKFIDLAKSGYKEHHPRAMKSNTNLEYSGIITFGNADQTLSRLEVDSLNQQQLDANAHKFIQDFAQKNGVKLAATYLVKHCDESMIHYHFKFVAFDFVKHEVMRGRMNPQFLVELQDLAGECFKTSGFVRGVKKFDRLEQTLYEMGLTYDDYKAMSPADKSVIMKEANIKNQAPRKLHSDLKNAAHNLQQSLHKSLTLFDLVDKSTPEELKAIKESVDNEGNKIVSRFFTYALRLQNEAADKAKAVKHLEETIEKLGEQKEALEADFRKFHENRYQAVQPMKFADLGIEPKKDKKAVLGSVVLSKKAYDDIQSYIQKIERNCRHFFEKYNEQAQILAPLNKHVKELKDLVTLKDELGALQAKKQTLSLDVTQFEKRIEKVESRLEKVLEMAVALQKDPTNSDLREEVKTEARRLQITDVKQLKDDIEDPRML
ncbi:MAG: hypothetical protein M0Q44_00295 [Methylobacter sp.]|jgi:hypothetical protein|nr:hypothetical protein [Methylobacter sp.]